MQHYGMSRSAFDSYIQMGMPAVMINRAWHGHKNNIDEWFRKITAYSSMETVEEGEG